MSKLEFVSKLGLSEACSLGDIEDFEFFKKFQNIQNFVAVLECERVCSFCL